MCDAISAMQAVVERHSHSQFTIQLLVRCTFVQAMNQFSDARTKAALASVLSAARELESCQPNLILGLLTSMHARMQR